MTIKVNKNECVGCGLCVSICPSVFEMKEGKAVVKSQKNEKCVDEAIDSCPKNAISK